MQSLRDFLDLLKRNGDLLITNQEVSANLELTEIQRRLIDQDGPALICNNVKKCNGESSDLSVLINLFGSKRRFCLGIGKTEQELAKLGQLLAFLRHPRPPKDLKDLMSYFPILKKVMSMESKALQTGLSQQNIMKDDKVDLDYLPIQMCWPNEPSPLITWGLVITAGPSYGTGNYNQIDDYNLGIYRMQKLDRNKLIMRWLAHRGGALQFKRWKETFPNQDMPLCVAIGADPFVTLSSVTPLPENLSEYKFAGFLRGSKTELVKAVTNDLYVPAHAEIILEGTISCTQTAKEGPYGDHTGYYNEVEEFPVFTVKAITTRNNPIYLTTYTCAPPDEPSILGECLNELIIPLLKEQFPEIVDFYLLPAACSYRMAVVSIKKSYPGQARIVMMGIWSYLKQFMYTKFVIVVDHDINIRDINKVIWAISTNVDPSRDSFTIDNTPIDYLDFASSVSGLGSKMGIDATTKLFPETNRAWGRKMYMDETTVKRIDDIWEHIFD